MLKSPHARRLIDLAGTERFPYETVLHIVRATSQRTKSQEEGYYYNTLYQRVAEVLAKRKVMKAAKALPRESGITVEWMSARIPDGTETDNYRFRQKHGTVVVETRDGKTVTDLDGIFLIDNHPFLLEVKMQPFGYFVDEQGKEYGSRLTRIIENHRRIRGYMPVREYFMALKQQQHITRPEDDIGIVVGMPSDHVNIRSGSLQSDFIKSGGILFPIMPLNDYFTLIQSYVHELRRKGIKVMRSQDQEYDPQL